MINDLQTYSDVFDCITYSDEKDTIYDSFVIINNIFYDHTMKERVYRIWYNERIRKWNQQRLKELSQQGKIIYLN